MTGNSGRKKGGGPYMPGVAYVPTPYCYRCFAETTPDKCDLLCARRVGEIMRLHLSGDVCAFIAEPVMGEGGIITPPDGYFKRVKEVLDEDGVLFIADEVQSGFGRTGKMFAIEHYGVEPDIMTMAKGIADGWPLSAFTARAEIADAFQVGDHLSTFGGNPVSCAAALANIEFLQSGVIEASAKKGADLKARFEALAKTQPLIGDVRGKGLMIGVELIADPQDQGLRHRGGRLRAPVLPRAQRAHRRRRQLRQRAARAAAAGHQRGADRRGLRHHRGRRWPRTRSSSDDRGPTPPLSGAAPRAGARRAGARERPGPLASSDAEPPLPPGRRGR